MWETVCVCARERQRERERVCVRERKKWGEKERENICMWEKKKCACVTNITTTLFFSPFTLHLPIVHISPAFLDMFAENCSYLQRMARVHMDGEYAINPPALDGFNVRIYCHNMSGDPTEYVTLLNYNWASKNNGVIGGSACKAESVHAVSNGTTVYNRLRVDVKVRRTKRVNGSKEMFHLTTHSTHFILRLYYGIRHMVKDHSDSKWGNPLPPLRGLLFPILYAPFHTQDSTYHGLCYTSRGALAGTRNSSMGSTHEGSIRRPIALWANALTTELHLAP